MVSDERGQLILVGAVAIALVLLGLVLIVNTALFTQVVGSEGTVETAKEGGVTGQEIGDAIGAVVAEQNRNGGGPGPPSVVDLERAIANRSVEQSGSFLSLGGVANEESGRTIQQDSNDSVGDWSPVTDGDVGEFLLTIDTANSDGETLDITVDPASATSKALTVQVASSGDEIDISGPGVEGCSEIRATSGTVRIDAYHGRVYEDGSCRFELFGNDTSSYDVEFSDTGVNATYRIVTSDTSINSPPDPTVVDIDTAIWIFSYEFTYETSAASVESDRREVDVYD